MLLLLVATLPFPPFPSFPLSLPSLLSPPQMDAFLLRVANSLQLQLGFAENALLELTINGGLREPPAACEHLRSFGVPAPVVGLCNLCRCGLCHHCHLPSAITAITVTCHHCHYPLPSLPDHTLPLSVSLSLRPSVPPPVR